MNFQDLSTTLWRNQSSGITIPPEIAQELELRWDRFLEGIGHLPTMPAEVPEIFALPSTEECGRQRLARHLTRERDPEDRATEKGNSHSLNWTVGM